VQDTTVTRIRCRATEHRARHRSGKFLGRIEEALVLNDLRYAIRLMRRSTGFGLVVILTLAIGIGLSTSLFSVVYAMFFRPLAVPAPDLLVYLYWTPGRLQNPKPNVMTRADYEFFRDNPEAFDGVTAHASRPATMSIDDVPYTVNGELVEANYFEVLQITPAIGRAFLPSDDATSPEPAAIISDRLWKRRFDRDPSVVGTTIRLGHDRQMSREVTIVGVMPPGFNGVADPWSPTDYWMTFDQNAGMEIRRLAVGPIARLKKGVTVAQAQAIVETQGQQLNRFRPGREKDKYWVFGARWTRMPYDPRASITPTRVAVSLSLAIAIVLAVSAVNVAGLMWARSMGRTSEVWVRRALGAHPLVIARQLMVESLAIAAMAGALGLLLAAWLLEIFRVNMPETFAVSVPLEPLVWAFASVLTVVIGILINLGPVLGVLRTRSTGMVPSVRSGETRLGRNVIQNFMIVPQVSLAIVLLVVAVTHARALLSAEMRGTGLDTGNVAVMSLMMHSALNPRDTPSDPAEQARRRRAFTDRLLAATEGLPGTASVALASRLPLRPSLGQPTASVTTRDAFLHGDAAAHGAEVISVSPQLFAGFGVRLHAGRPFDAHDSSARPKVAIVSRTLASRLWPFDNPLGKALTTGSARANPSDQAEWREVIGIAEDVAPLLGADSPVPWVYLPIRQDAAPFPAHVLARMSVNGPQVVRSLKAAVSAADPLVEVYRVQTIEQIIEDVIYPRRLAASVVGAGAFITLCLVTVGLGGAMAHSVARRTPELGVRMTLGADLRSIVRLVIGEAAMLVLIGAGIGLAGAQVVVLASQRFFEYMPGLDPLALLSVPATVVLIVLTAGYVPARKAASVSPMDALRTL
jgi:putative ABC transport system permease protein